MSEQEKYWKVKEFARHFRISNMSAYRMVNAGEVKSIKLGQSIRIPQSEVDRLEGIPAQDWGKDGQP